MDNRWKIVAVLLLGAVAGVSIRSGLVHGQSTIVPGLSTVANTGQYTDLLNLPTIPTTTSQLTNNSGFLTTANSISGTFTVPTTFLSYGTQTVTQATGMATATSIWECDYNVPSSTGSAAISVFPSVVSAGTLNIIMKNVSLSTLTGGYMVSYFCYVTKP